MVAKELDINDWSTLFLKRKNKDYKKQRSSEAVEQLFDESVTSFGVITDILDEDLYPLQGNRNLSSENRDRVDYEVRVRKQELPESWKLNQYAL